MNNFELKDAILDYIIEAHQKVKNEKQINSNLPTYDDIRNHFNEVDKERFIKQFSIVRDEFLEEENIREEDKVGKKKRVFKENKEAKKFLYDEEGYKGRYQKRALEREVAKATKNSSRSAATSAFASVLLFITSIFQMCEDDNIMPLVDNMNELLEENQIRVDVLQKRIDELEVQIEGAGLDNKDTLNFDSLKTHKKSPH
jgi:hypothetical protein